MKPVDLNKSLSVLAILVATAFASTSIAQACDGLRFGRRVPKLSKSKGARAGKVKSEAKVDGESKAKADSTDKQ